VFPQGVKSKALKKRFDEYMQFVKADYSDVPFRSGSDNEPSPNEMLQGIEDMYDDWTSFNNKAQSTKAGDIAQKKRDRDAAETIRKAAMGKYYKKGSAIMDLEFAESDNEENNSDESMYTADSREDDATPGDILDRDSPPAKKTKKSPTVSVTSSSKQKASTKGSKKSKPVDNHAATLASLAGLKDAAQLREQRKNVHQEYKSQQLEQSQQKLDLEQKRFELEVKKFEVERREREANAQLMAALAASLTAKRDSKDKNMDNKKSNDNNNNNSKDN
jgi:hypothetical protein